MRRVIRRLPFAIGLLAVAVTLSAQLTAEPPATRPSAPPQLAIDWEKVATEAIGKLSEYLRIDTSNPPGNETRAVEWLKKVFDAEGIAYETAESAPGRGNIVARLKATSPAANKEPGLVLLHHMDVVPVSREYWTAEPFSGEVREGTIWGRGSEDMKGQGTAQLMAFLLLHRTKTPLRRDVIFLATADEEAGGNFGAGWVVANRPQWYAGAGFLINEGARSRADQSGRPLYFGIGIVNKSPAWLKLTATGRTGHGSLPIADSAVNRLIAALERLRTYEPPLEVTPPIERALATQAPFEPEPWPARLANIREYVKTPEARGAGQKTRTDPAADQYDRDHRPGRHKEDQRHPAGGHRSARLPAAARLGDRAVDRRGAAHHQRRHHQDRSGAELRHAGVPAGHYAARRHRTRREATLSRRRAGRVTFDRVQRFALVPREGNRQLRLRALCAEGQRTAGGAWQRRAHPAEGLHRRRSPGMGSSVQLLPLAVRLVCKGRGGLAMTCSW